MLYLMLGGKTQPVNGHDQTVQSGSYCYSSVNVASFDEVNPAIVFVLFVCFVGCFLFVCLVVFCLFVFSLDLLKSSVI